LQLGGPTAMVCALHSLGVETDHPVSFSKEAVAQVCWPVHKAQQLLPFRGVPDDE